MDWADEALLQEYEPCPAGADKVTLLPVQNVSGPLGVIVASALPVATVLEAVAEEQWS